MFLLPYEPGCYRPPGDTRPRHIHGRRKKVSKSWPGSDYVDSAFLSFLFFFFVFCFCCRLCCFLLLLHMYIYSHRTIAYTRSLATTDSSAPAISQQVAQLLVTLEQADAVKSSLQNETQRLRDQLQKFQNLAQQRNKEARFTQQLKEERELTAKVTCRLKHRPFGFVANCDGFFW